MKDQDYLLLILLHIAIGIGVFYIPFLSMAYAIFIFLAGIIYIVKHQNKQNEVLVVAAYITGSEILLRASHGVPVYEFAKYAVAILMLYGMFYSGFSKNAIPYWVYILLLIPAVLLATFVLNGDTEDRKIISFTISGPFCLGICALYTYQRKVMMETVEKILLAMGLPILSFATYLIFYNPSIKEVITGTDSNFATSGGFGPNQVSTILGLGIFIFFVRIILNSKNPFVLLVNATITIVLTFRAIVTFSRGGVFTAAIIIVFFLLCIYYYSKYRTRVKINYLVMFTLLATMAIWGYSSMQTHGFIEKRYANQDAKGRIKKSKMSGREDLMSSELEMFYSHPILGVGVGKSIEMRKEKTGIDSASHNEITRLLAEHGALGILILLILFFTPIFLFLDNKQHIFLFSFLFFWILTINHAAMRIAAPAFVYSLALLKVYIFPPPPPKESKSIV